MTKKDEAGEFEVFFMDHTEVPDTEYLKYLTWPSTMPRVIFKLWRENRELRSRLEKIEESLKRA